MSVPRITNVSISVVLEARASRFGVLSEKGFPKMEVP